MRLLARCRSFWELAPAKNKNVKLTKRKNYIKLAGYDDFAVNKNQQN